MQGLALPSPNHASSSKGASAQLEVPQLDVAQIYAVHGAFLWKCLCRMGVSEADLPDAMQEVLLVVHRRLDSYDPSCKLSTWLFGIGLRVAQTTRRKRARRREAPLEPDEGSLGATSPEDAEERIRERDARHRLDRVLAGLDPEQRALFTLYEIDDLPGAQIAELLGIPLGTVHSRLSKLRERFYEALRRLEAQEAKLRGGST